MHDFFDLIHSRRSIRRYEARPVPAQLIEQLLEAAVWAPSAHNRQPWRLVVIEGEAVSYTHLDVYKRQTFGFNFNFHLINQNH